MANIFLDRVKVQSTTTGTGTYTIGTAPAIGCRNFTAFTDGQTTTYCVESADRTAWEINEGVVGGSGTTLTRVLLSSSSGSAISWTPGTRDVYCCPAGSRIVPTTPSYLEFDVAGASGAVGRLKWNNTDGTLDLGMLGGNVTQQIGQESYIRIRNNTGSLIADGMVVRLTGSIGTRATAALSQADSLANSQNTIGIVTEDISNNGEGFVTTFGLVRNFNTTALTEGATVFLSASSPGGMTSTEPSLPNISLGIGVCIRSHVNQGVILVAPNYGSRLQTLNEVSIAAAGSGNIDWSVSSAAIVTLGAGTSGSYTITFSNLSKGRQMSMLVEGGSATTPNLVWPAGVKWAGGAAPTQTSVGIDRYEFCAINITAASVRGYRAGAAFA